jgi:hypothetical protein
MAEHLATDVEPTEPFTPTISTKARTVAYFTIGIGAPVVGLVTGISAIWFPEVTTEVSATGVTVLAFIGTVAGVFGIAYRPTK